MMTLCSFMLLVTWNTKKYLLRSK